MRVWRSDSGRSAGHALGSLGRRLWRARHLLPILPYLSQGGSLLIAQAVVLRDPPEAPGEGVSGEHPTQQVLLVHRTNPRAWELPGGRVEEGEDPAESAVREVEEETAVTVSVVRRLGLYRRTGFRAHQAVVFVCRVVAGTARPNWESVAVAWFPVDALPDGLFPWYRPIITDATTGVQHLHEQRQHLGARVVLESLAIHLRGLLRRERGPVSLQKGADWYPHSSGRAR